MLLASGGLAQPSASCPHTEAATPGDRSGGCSGSETVPACRWPPPRDSLCTRTSRIWAVPTSVPTLQR